MQYTDEDMAHLIENGLSQHHQQQTSISNHSSVDSPTITHTSYQYMNPLPAGYGVPTGADFSPRVAKRGSEREEVLDETLVMHIREAFLPFNDPAPNTMTSKRCVLVY